MTQSTISNICLNILLLGLLLGSVDPQTCVWRKVNNFLGQVEEEKTDTLNQLPFWHKYTKPSDRVKAKAGEADKGMFEEG